MPRTTAQARVAVACVIWTAVSAAQVFSPGDYSRAGYISGSGQITHSGRATVGSVPGSGMCSKFAGVSGVVPCTGVGIGGACRRDWVVSTFMSRMASAETVECHADAFEDAMLAHCVLRVYRARGLIQAL